MKAESISRIWIDSLNRLCIEPDRTAFDMIYRSAMGVQWNAKNHYLYSQMMHKWTPADWFHQIIAALGVEYGYHLYITEKTKWENIDEFIKKSIEINDKILIMVAEPWNFESSDGLNKFYCKITNESTYNGKEIVIAKCLSQFKIGDKTINYIALSNRDSSGNYNIFVIDDPNKFGLNKQNFKIIGSIAQK